MSSPIVVKVSVPREKVTQNIVLQGAPIGPIVASIDLSVIEVITLLFQHLFKRPRVTRTVPVGADGYKNANRLGGFALIEIR